MQQMLQQWNHSMEKTENNIVLYGASGHCKVIIDILEMNNEKIFKIIDDNPKYNNILSKKIINSNEFVISKSHILIICIGNNFIRKKLAVKLKVKFKKAIHPNALISKYSIIGDGTVVMAGVIINADSKIGQHCIINTGSVIEHDCNIHNFVHVCPNVSLGGGVEIQEGTQIGIGATIIHGIKVGKWAIIGAGSIIIKDVPDFAIVVGNPGKIIKANFDEK